MFPFWPGYLVFFVFSIFVTFIFPPFYEQMLRLNMCCSERDVDSPASETEPHFCFIKKLSMRCGGPKTDRFIANSN